MNNSMIQTCYNIIIKNGIAVIMGTLYLAQTYPLLALYIYLKCFSANYYIFFFTSV